MNGKYESAMIELLSVYANIDLIAMELCAARLPYAPDLEAKLDLALQVEEERRHYLMQVERLRKWDHELREKIPKELVDHIKTEFAKMDWLEFLSSLQIAIEGIGISVIEEVHSKADSDTRKALDIPIAEEKRQTQFAVERIKRILQSATPEERKLLQKKIVEKIWAMRGLFFEIDLPFQTLWDGVGVPYQRIKKVLYERAEAICDELGIAFAA